MQTGSMPIASIHGTWLENVEVVSILDDTPFDLSSVTEITLKLMDPWTRFVWMTLTMTNGEITIPAADQGIIQWRVEKDHMGVLDAKTYDMLLVLEDETDEVPLILGPLSVVE